MIEDLLRRWQVGWCMSRGLRTVDETDGVLVIKVYQDERSVEYVPLDCDEHAERLSHAVELAHESTGSWVTVATRRRDEVAAQLQAAGLRVHPGTEWLMTIPLVDQPALPLNRKYTLVTDPGHDVIVMRAMQHGSAAASGRMAVVGTDAVADRIETVPAHRRRGLGSALMAALVEQARREGAERGILIASPDGLHLYESLGWEIVANVIVARV